MPVVEELFHPAVSSWFTESLGEPTEPQEQAWPSIQKRQPTLIAAPTGSGKTLASFLAIIDKLVREAVENGGLPEQTRVVYVSPLKALSNDIEINLHQPLLGIQERLEAAGHAGVEIRSWVRTGDTPSSERTRMLKHPPHILVTTPESLYILLTSDGGRGMLQTTETVIVDEIHAMVGDKRGSHLAVTLERLERLVDGDLLRIGLSATQNPIEKVAEFLFGQEECNLVDLGHRRQLDLALELPQSPLEAVMSNEVWEEIYDRLAELILAHQTTLVFVNTRRLAERAAKHLSDRLGKGALTSHHGSLSRDQRLDAEKRLKAGDLRALVATASLELGIDIGGVDLVCQLGTTRTISTLLQRVGRSGHAVGGVSKGRLFPLSRDELVEAVALCAAIKAGHLDRLEIPERPLDILAQQIVACVACEDWDESELYETLTRAYPFRRLDRSDYDEIVAMLRDGFSTRNGRRGAYIHHDRVQNRLRGRRGARLAALTNGGAIPDSADYDVVLEPDE
ncbi:MAG: DEAD/DEAH box helicase, partial [Acidobacteriota bacterium]|nr:DEAD/DEAH box helicase [Acidobacteriota bacterium]